MAFARLGWLAGLAFALACVSYQTTQLRPTYQNEETGEVWGTPVTYLSSAERAAHALSVRDGRLVDAEGERLDTGERGIIFVMTEDGGLLAAHRVDPGRFHHSSLVAGAAVAGAGELFVDDGVLVAVSDESGHYQPAVALTLQVLRRLSDLGVDLSRVTLRLVGEDEVNALDYLSSD